MKPPYMERFPDVPITLGEQLERCAVHFGDHPGVVDLHTTLTWSQVDYAVSMLAAILVDHGVCPGDRILIGMERKHEIVLAYLAVARIGAISVPLNFKAPHEEQRQIIDLIHPIGGIYHRQVLDQCVCAGESVWSLCLDDSEFACKLNRMLAAHEKDQIPYDWSRVNPDDPAYLNMTSGSTGCPKAAIASHRILYGNTRACIEALMLDETDVHLPLFAVMAHPHEIFCRALFTGATIVLLDNLYPRTIAETIQRFKVTCIMAVPPVYKLLLPFLSSRKFDVSSLRLPESGGMTTSQSLASRFREITGIPIIPVWGSTESMGIAFHSTIDGLTPHNSVGKLLPGYSAKIIDRNGIELDTGEVGELCLRGIGVMSAYWDNPGLTNSVMIDGWYHSGDLFERDKKGNFYFHGRLDAMMKVGGVKIYPAEIEAALFSHPLIREAVVLPFDDSERGVVPLAIIVTEPGEVLTEKQLRLFLKDKLAKNKMPRMFRFLPDLPRTSSGKVDRKALTCTGNLEREPSDESLERRLEAIDLKILYLLNERLRIESAMRTDIKSQRFQPERIQETIQKLLEFNPGPLHDSLVEDLFKKILSLRTLY